MQAFTKQNYFYFIAFMLIASTYLPIVFNNLPPLIRSHHIWTALWSFSLLVFYPAIFLDKKLIFVFGYGLFLLLASLTVWSKLDNWNFNMLFKEFYEVIIGTSVITFYYQRREYLILAKLAKWAIIFLVVTAIMTIIASSINPLYARDITAVGKITNEIEIEAILSFKKYGAGTYSTAAAFMCLFPILIYFYKINKTNLFSRVQILLSSTILFLALIGMQIFGNILIVFIFSIIGLMGMRRLRSSILVTILFLSIMIIIPKEMYTRSLLSASNYFREDSNLYFKLNDFAHFIESGADFNDNSTASGVRAERYPMLVETFLKRPILGCYFLSDEYANGYKVVGGHLYWMNKVTVTGIIGLVVFIIILFRFAKSNLLRFNPTYKFYYLLAAFSIISYGLIKNITGRETWYAFFIILPGLYYLPLLKRPNIDSLT